MILDWELLHRVKKTAKVADEAVNIYQVKWWDAQWVVEGYDYKVLQFGLFILPLLISI